MLRRVLAICLSVLLGLTVFSGCSKDPVVAKVGNSSIPNSRFKQIFDSYTSYFGITDPTAADQAEAVAQLRDLILETLVTEEIQLQKAKSLGLDQLTDAMKAEVDAEIQGLMEEFHSRFETEAKAADATLTGDALEKKVQTMIDDYLKEYGYTRALIKQEYTDTYIKNRLYEQSTANVVISDAELLETYQTRIAEVKEIYAEDASTFESDFMGDVTLYYIPEGYRQVKHILIMLPQDTIDQIASLREDGYDKEADSIRATALKSIKDKASEVLAKLASDGSNFDELMKQYTGDTAALDIPNGYAVSKQGQFTQEFIKGCFAIKDPMTISGLVAGDYGYHIILYIETLLSGNVAFETVKADIETELLSVAKEDAFNALLEQWRSETKVTLYPENSSYYKAPSAATPTAAVISTPAASVQPTP